jgi:hypothetical protein
MQENNGDSYTDSQTDGADGEGDIEMGRGDFRMGV